MHRNSNKALDIKMEMTFDNENRHLYYFAGDTIQGKVFLTSNQNNFNLTRHFRFAWTGTIQVHPIEKIKDSRVFFTQLYKLSNRFYKTIAKTEKGTLPLYVCEFINPDDQDEMLQKNEGNDIVLQKKKTIAITFNVKVPNDRTLPSSTETNNSSNKIIYLLEAFIINENKRPTFFCQRLAPIYERIYTQPLMEEQKDEKVFTIYNGLNVIATAALRATLPCLGCQAGITIPVSISIWNNQEFTRKQGIAVSLIRINHVYANDRIYMSQAEKIHRVVTDLNLVKREKGRKKEEDNDMSIQIIHVGLPIPKNILPTITFESSHLLSVSYFVRVQVYAQQGVYQFNDDRSEFMIVDLPFIIGTIPTNPQDSNNHFTLPPPLLQQQQTPVVKSSTDVSPSSSNNSITSDYNNNNNKKNDNIKSTKKITRNILKGGIFRKSSSNSESSSSATANIVEILELELQDNSNNKISNHNIPFKLYEEVEEEKKVTKNNFTSTLNQIEQLTITEYQDDNTSSSELTMKTVMDDDDDILDNKKNNDIRNSSSSINNSNIRNSSIISRSSVNNSNNSKDNNDNSRVVFNMFFDEDSDDEIEYSSKNKSSNSDYKDTKDCQLTAQTKIGLDSNKIQQKRENKENNTTFSDPLSSSNNVNFFQLFPDSDDE